MRGMTWVYSCMRWGGGLTYLISMTELGLSSVVMDALLYALVAVAAPVLASGGVEESASLEIFSPPWLMAPPPPRLSLGLSSGGTGVCDFHAPGIGRWYGLVGSIMETFEYLGKGIERGARPAQGNAVHHRTRSHSPGSCYGIVSTCLVYGLGSILVNS